VPGPRIMFSQWRRAGPLKTIIIRQRTVKVDFALTGDEIGNPLPVERPMMWRAGLRLLLGEMLKGGPACRIFAAAPAMGGGSAEDRLSLIQGFAGRRGPAAHQRQRARREHRLESGNRWAMRRTSRVGGEAHFALPIE
jgi:hypothetical protein